MKNKSYCNPARRRRAISRQLPSLLLWVAILLCVPPALAGDAPQWMHEQVNASLPNYDQKTDVVLLYSETTVSVLSADKIKTHVRETYKILRPDGRHYGTVFVYFNSHKKVTSLHGWCIPAQGKDFEVKDKDAMDISAPNVEGSELISDVKAKVLHIPAPDPGNIIGYEYEVEEQPFVLQDTWYFQETAPSRQTHYSIQLPPGWEYKASWLNHAEVAPTQSGTNSWQWALSDVKGIRKEPLMPPFEGVAGQMIVSFFTSGAPALNANADWNTMGKWYLNLVGERVGASPDIKQKVA